MKDKIRVSDYIAKFLENIGITKIFMVTGGGAMFLNDGIAKSKKIKGIFNSRTEASKYREMILSCGVNVEIETYTLLDTLED